MVKTLGEQKIKENRTKILMKYDENDIGQTRRPNEKENKRQTLQFLLNNKSETQRKKTSSLYFELGTAKENDCYITNDSLFKAEKTNSLIYISQIS